MTDREIATTYLQRQLFNQLVGSFKQRLKDMPPEVRRQADDASRRFHVADRAIVYELRSRPAPVTVQGRTFWLTKDRAHFVALKPGTFIPDFAYPYTHLFPGLEVNALYQYPKTV